MKNILKTVWLTDKVVYTAYLSGISPSTDKFQAYLFIFFQALDVNTAQLSQMQISVLVLHLIFHCLTAVNLIKGITLKIRLLWFVLENSVLFNLFMRWEKSKAENYNHLNSEPDPNFRAFHPWKTVA